MIYQEYSNTEVLGVENKTLVVCTKMESTIPVVKFSGDNWTIWRFQTQIALKSKGLCGVVTGEILRPSNSTEDWDRRDARSISDKIRGQIFKSCNDL